jgi:hypothetical protein
VCLEFSLQVYPDLSPFRQAHKATYAALAEPSKFKPQAACASGFTYLILIPVTFHITYWYGESPHFGYIPASELKIIVANLNKQFTAFKPRFRFIYTTTTYKKYTGDLSNAKFNAETSISYPL